MINPPDVLVTKALVWSGERASLHLMSRGSVETASKDHGSTYTGVWIATCVSTFLVPPSMILTRR